MRVGVDKKTGLVLHGWDHCAQSISVILSTMIGSRVMRREFGSYVPQLIDAPQNQRSFVQFVSRAAAALKRWEPGFRLTRVELMSVGADGTAAFWLAGDFFEDGHLGIFTRPTPVTAQFSAANLMAGGA